MVSPLLPPPSQGYRDVFYDDELREEALREARSGEPERWGSVRGKATGPTTAAGGRAAGSAGAILLSIADDG